MDLCHPSSLDTPTDDEDSTGSLDVVTTLPTPEFDDAEDWVRRHLGELSCDPDVEWGVPVRRGGQRAADAALAGLDIEGYARSRSVVHPPGRRGATALSPYIRHGLLTLPEVAAAVNDGRAGGSDKDRTRYLDELRWQEYSRHLYARVGTANRRALRREPARAAKRWDEPLPTDMECLNQVTEELTSTGWLVNQTRMWLASQWTVRAGHDWARGEDWMFRHLLDGSRAANRFGWQWTVGAMTGKVYGFSRWQVDKRAPAWCRRCELQDRCPIEDWPSTEAGPKLDDNRLKRGETSAGPTTAEIAGSPDAVWITGESMGHRDPALAAHPDLPAIFVFDRPLLARLRLSGKRLRFLAETLADLAQQRSLTIHLDSVPDALAGLAVAVTFAPVPGYTRRRAATDVVAEYPFPWLTRPDEGTVTSFSAWNRRMSD
jgi:deoxyribodipyrimidine photo-lyase